MCLHLLLFINAVSKIDTNTYPLLILITHGTTPHNKIHIPLQVAHPTKRRKQQKRILLPSGIYGSSNHSTQCTQSYPLRQRNVSTKQKLHLYLSICNNLNKSITIILYYEYSTGKKFRRTWKFIDIVTL
jgi:hypothetical protein